MKHRVSVFGSCISRDILDYDKEHFLPGAYVARQSFISSLSPSPDVCIDPERINLTSSFQRRVVGWDINKKAFEVLSDQKGPLDYLLVDFFEERFDLVEFGGSIATYSNEFARSGLGGGKRIPWYSFDFVVGGRSVYDYFSDFVSALLSIYPQEKIVLVIGLLCNTYICLDGSRRAFSKETIASNEIINKKLGLLYNRFVQLAPKVRTIDMCLSFRGYEGNRWGLANTHYEDSFYRHAANQLLRITEGAEEPVRLKLGLWGRRKLISFQDHRLLSR